MMLLQIIQRILHAPAAILHNQTLTTRICACSYGKSSVVRKKPVITVPYHMTKRIRSYLEMKEREKKQEMSDYKAKKSIAPIVACKKKMFNQYTGFTHPRFKEVPLASKGWKKSKSAGDYFTLCAHKGNPSLVREDAEIQSFSQLNVNAKLVSKLRELGITKPSKCQVKAIPELLARRNALVCSETGCGKTLAYLLPLLHHVHNHVQQQRDTTKVQEEGEIARGLRGETQGGEELDRGMRVETQRGEELDRGMRVETQRGEELDRGIPGETRGGGDVEEKGSSRWMSRNFPSALILVPSIELVRQVHDMCRELCAVLGLTCHHMVGRHGTTTYRLHGRGRGQVRADLVIGTPGMLDIMITAKRVNVSNIVMCVLDEADTLLDDSFSAVTSRILQQFSINSGIPESHTEPLTGAQLVCVAATVPRNVADILDGVVEVGTLVHLKSEYLHHILPHVSQRFIRVSSKKRDDEILGIVQSAVRRGMPMIVFCNHHTTATWLHYYLLQRDVANLCLHRNVDMQERRGVFKAFKEGKCNVLVCTDIASRGLDTSHVQHVVNFEFPRHMSDYIHRCGRVGRVGSRGPAGRVTNLVTFRRDVLMTQHLEHAARCSKVLTDKVDANITRRVAYHRVSKQLRMEQRQERSDAAAAATAAVTQG